MKGLADVSIGYPDGQRIQNWDGVLGWNLPIQAVPNPLTSPVMDVSRYASVAGQMQCPVGQALLTFTWYADQARTLQLGARQIVLSANIASIGNYLLPNMGPFLQVQVVSIGAGVANVALTVSPSNRQRVLELLPQFPAQVTITNETLAANATNTHYPQEYVAGPVYCHATANQAWTLRLEYLNNAGVWTTLFALIETAAGVFFGSFPVPLGAWRIDVQNNTATATTDTIRLWQSPTGSS